MPHALFWAGEARSKITELRGTQTRRRTPRVLQRQFPQVRKLYSGNFVANYHALLQGATISSQSVAPLFSCLFASKAPECYQNKNDRNKNNISFSRHKTKFPPVLQKSPDFFPFLRTSIAGVRRTIRCSAR